MDIGVPHAKIQNGTWAWLAGHLMERHGAPVNAGLHESADFALRGKRWIEHTGRFPLGRPEFHKI